MARRISRPALFALCGLGIALGTFAVGTLAVISYHPLPQALLTGLGFVGFFAAMVLVVGCALKVIHLLTERR